MPDFQPSVTITALDCRRHATSAQKVRGEFQAATNVNSIQLRSH
jgi:hypothetical protein